MVSIAWDAERTYSSPDALIRNVLGAMHSVLGRPSTPLALHEPEFSGKELEYVTDCIDTGWVSSVGSYVDRFERDLAGFTGAAHAIATSNGTAALHTCMLLAAVEPGDEVLLPTLTFIATANAVSYVGAIPHFVDSEDISLGIDAAKLDEYLREEAQIVDGVCRNRHRARIRALVVMHVFGHRRDLDALADVASRWQLILIEDAAESLGSLYHGRHTGNVGALAALSFNGNKVVTTGGGGAVLTNDPVLARHARASDYELQGCRIDGASFTTRSAITTGFRISTLPLGARNCFVCRMQSNASADSRRRGVLWCRSCPPPARAGGNLQQLLVERDRAGAAVCWPSRGTAARTQRRWVHVPTDLDADAQAANVRSISAHERRRRGGLGGPRYRPVEREAGRMTGQRKRVCVVTGSRSEYGLLYWILHDLRADSAFELQLIVTGMHLAPEFGLTVREIEADGFVISRRVEMLLASDTSGGVAKSMGLGVIGMSDAIEQLAPDLVLVLGDRFEILPAVQACLMHRIPVAHVAGGDTSEGAVDESIRHAITKMAHVHFVTNEQSAQRVRQMGEEAKRVHVVGSPGHGSSAPQAASRS